MSTFGTRLFWALARFIALSAAALQLSALYGLEAEVRGWLSEHRDWTTIALTFYLVMEVLYWRLLDDAEKVRDRGKQMEREEGDAH